MRAKPVLLDAFCKAGGATKGYQLAGFHVIGVDIEPQPNYVGDEFVQGDALEMIPLLASTVDAVAASPPCQDHSVTRFTHGGATHGTGWMLAETLRLVEATGLPWVVENVEGADLGGAWSTFCGTGFGLNSRRHRRFASSLLLMPPPCRHGDFPLALGVNGHSEQGHVFRKWRAALGRTPLHADRCEAMGIDWMNRDELAQAIPPAMTEFIGEQLIWALAPTPEERDTRREEAL